MRIIDDFEKKIRTESQRELISLACGKDVPMYLIGNIYDLTQFVGYAKYVNCKDSRVFLRGQTKLHGGKMEPSLFRNTKKTIQILTNFNQRINQILKIESFRKFNKQVLIGTLQHYGIKSPQIDVVDNLWVALWFAVNEFHGTVIGSHEHLVATDSKEDYGYIFLLASDATVAGKEPGTYEGERTDTIDLRQALPSFYLRPHAQHAFMLRKKAEDFSDYSDLIVGIAKIPTYLISGWIGNTELLSVSGLFPSAYYDSGYEALLSNFPAWNSTVVKSHGSIQIVSG